MTRPTVLIIDDEGAVTDVLAASIRSQGMRTICANSVREAACILDLCLPDLILLDLVMPEVSGADFLQQLLNYPPTSEVPVIMMSGSNDVDTMSTCILSGVDDFLEKPIAAWRLHARIRASLAKQQERMQERHRIATVLEENDSLQKRLGDQTRGLRGAHLTTVSALARVAESRDATTGGHLQRIRSYVRALALQLRDMDLHAELLTDAYIDDLTAASALHDLGKIGTPDYILLKPGRLTREETDVMRRHTLTGKAVLQDVLQEHPENEIIRLATEIAASHHERWDGTGYPLGIAGEKIPLSGRIVALADVYDALTSPRPYKGTFTPKTAKAMILAEEGKHFSPNLITAFLAVERDFAASCRANQGIDVMLTEDGQGDIPRDQCNRALAAPCRVGTAETGL